MTAPKPEQNGHGHFDLDAAVEAAIAEATGRPFRFQWRGKLYELPNQKLWPIAATDALVGSGNFRDFMDQLGHVADYNQLVADGINQAALEKLMNAVAEQSGVGDLPNSSPPRRRATTRT